MYNPSTHHQPRTTAPSANGMASGAKGQGDTASSRAASAAVDAAARASAAGDGAST